MTVETKFEIGDMVYFMANNKMCKGTVEDISLDSLRHKVISYKVRERNSTGSWNEIRNEKTLFATQGELLDNLRLT